MEKWNQTSYHIPDEFNAIINSAYPGIKDILSIEDQEEQRKKLKMLYQIGLLAQGKLEVSNLTDFIHSLI